MDTAEIQKRETLEKVSETKNWFFEKINKVDKTLDRLINNNKKEYLNY